MNDGFRFSAVANFQRQQERTILHKLRHGALRAGLLLCREQAVNQPGPDFFARERFDSGDNISCNSALGMTIALPILHESFQFLHIRKI
ncbi:MAG: hypothetical protein WBD73_00605 [Candidatus Acidiferrales bacterium]